MTDINLGQVKPTAVVHLGAVARNLQGVPVVSPDPVPRSVQDFHAAIRALRKKKDDQ